MAKTGVKGRAVLIDLHHHFVDARTDITYEMLETVMKQDGITVDQGYILCLHTGLGQLIRDDNGKLDNAIKMQCAVLDGHDK